MKRRLQVIIVLGAVVLICGFIYWNKQTGHFPRSVLTWEPTYEGETLSYWMAHWYQQYDQPNLQAHEAIRTMGTDAAPFLGRMMNKRAMVDAATPDFDFYVPLLQAFEILGSNAQPATPYLIKSLGRNFGKSETALVSIGKGAVPPLAEKLVETLSDTKDPYYDTGIRMAVRTSSGYFIRDRILGVLSRLGTNAEAALPALIKTVATNRHQPYFLREGHWMGGGFFEDPYNVLARVGQNHPEIVVPILLEEFSNSSLPLLTNKTESAVKLQKRNQIIAAIKVFGTNQAKAFMPVLIAALSDNRTNDLSRIQMGDTLMEIGNDQPAILIPAFLAALTNQSNPEPVRCAMAGYLAEIGTNQPDLIVPVLKTAYTNVSLYGRSSIAGALAGFPKQSRSMVPLMLSDCDRKAEHPWDIRWRINLTKAIKTIAPDMPGTLTPLLRDLKDVQGGIRQQTIYALGDLGTNGYAAVPALLKCLSHPDAQTRTDAIRALNKIGLDSDEYITLLGENLSYTNHFTAGEAESTLANLAKNSKLAFVTLIKKGMGGGLGRDDRFQCKWALIEISRVDPTFMLECLGDSDASIRSGTLSFFYDLARRVPSAIPKLRELAEKDPDANVRSRAADVLKLQLQ